MRRIAIVVLALLALPDRAQPETPEASLELPLSGRGIIVAVQDWVGDSDATSLVESLLTQGLSEHITLSEPTQLRGALRQRRIRAITRATPEEIERLAATLGVDWFLSASLLEADSDLVSQITVGADLFRAGSRELAWTAIESATSLDDLTWLGIGGEKDLPQLAELVVERLLANLLSGPNDKLPRPRFGISRAGFLSEPPPERPSGPVAVIPFNTLAENDAPLSTALATAALRSCLYEYGYQLLFPGVVLEVLRRQGSYQIGEVGKATRKALYGEEQTAWILTGTVETFESRPRSPLGPWIAFSTRLVQAETGRILWSDGAERQGIDSLRAFQQGIVISSGVLTKDMMRSLVASFTDHRRTSS